MMQLGKIFASNLHDMHVCLQASRAFHCSKMLFLHAETSECARLCRHRWQPRQDAYTGPARSPWALSGCLTGTAMGLDRSSHRLRAAELA